MPRSCLWAEFTGPNGRTTVPGCGFSGPFWFNCSDDTPQHLKPIPPCLLRRMAKNNDFFIFPHPPGAGALTSCGVLNGKILRKESAASHKRNSNPTFISPRGICLRDDNPPRFSRAGSAGARLPIVNQAVHNCAYFFDYIIPFFTVFQHGM